MKELKLRFWKIRNLKESFELSFFVAKLVSLNFVCKDKQKSQYKSIFLKILTIAGVCGIIYFRKKKKQ